MSVCRYEVIGNPAFPARVRLSFFGKDSVTTSWLDTLSSPGVRLLGYVPEEQRRVALRWAWDGGPEYLPKRSEWQGEQISGADIRTPEGTVHRVPVGSKQVRIPELTCKDNVTYQYVGSRYFK